MCKRIWLREIMGHQADRLTVANSELHAYWVSAVLRSYAANQPWKTLSKEDLPFWHTEAPPLLIFLRATDAHVVVTFLSSFLAPRDIEVTPRAGFLSHFFTLWHFFFCFKNLLILKYVCVGGVSLCSGSHSQTTTQRFIINYKCWASSSGLLLATLTF